MSATKEAPAEEQQRGLSSVEAWRFEQLLRAGWQAEHAEVIAISSVDLHKACAMVAEQGCSSQLAFQILA